MKQRDYTDPLMVKLRAATAQALKREHPKSCYNNDLNRFSIRMENGGIASIDLHGVAELIANRMEMSGAETVVLATPLGCFKLGTRMRKKSGSKWQGEVVGYYSTDLTPVGYAIESETEVGSVQIYPAAALELVEDAKAD